MKILSVDHYLAQRVISLDETLDLISFYSRPHLGHDTADRIVAAAARLLRLTGFRQCRVRAPGERFYQNYVEVAKHAIATAGLSPRDISVVIYFGVGRGYREPATAYQLAEQLGIRAECFDVLDACSGWGRSVKLVESLFRRDEYQNALLISLEFNRSRHMGMDAVKRDDYSNVVYGLRSPDDLARRLWGATVGEAGSVTVLGKGPESAPWYFDFVHAPDQHDLCGWSLVNHEDFEAMPHPLLDGTETELFWSRALEIGGWLREELPPLLAKVPAYLEEAAVLLPHTLSARIYQRIFREFKVEGKALDVFGDVGNCVSCGVPVNLSHAVQQGRLRRGERAVCTPSGSGASTGVISFLY
jgi:3-oxoacyl-[acyl-carrier-protein] synthase III